MYAIIGTWTVFEDADTGTDGLRDALAPSAADLPGLVCALWMRDPETGKGYSAVVVDSEAAAQTRKAAMLARSQDAARAGIVNDTLVIADVLTWDAPGFSAALSDFPDSPAFDQP